MVKIKGTKRASLTPFFPYLWFLYSSTIHTIQYYSGSWKKGKGKRIKEGNGRMKRASFNPFPFAIFPGFLLWFH